MSSTTAVEFVNVNAAPVAVYDLKGRKMESAKNGVYIIDGEKKFVK